MLIIATDKNLKLDEHAEAGKGIRDALHGTYFRESSCKVVFFWFVWFGLMLRYG